MPLSTGDSAEGEETSLEASLRLAGDEGIGLLDSDLSLLSWNERFVEMGIVPADDLRPGLSLATIYRIAAQRGFFGAGDPDATARELLDRFRSGQAPPAEDLIGPEDTVLKIRRKILPGGYLVAVFSDVTELRRSLGRRDREHPAGVERLLGERTRALRASNRALRVLIECCQALVRTTSESDLLDDERSPESFDNNTLVRAVLSAWESAKEETAADLGAVDPGLIGILSNRELEVVELVAERLRDKEIAARLFIAPQTVKSHLRNIYRKLDVHDRRSLVKCAVANGLIKRSQ